MFVLFHIHTIMLVCYYIPFTYIHVNIVCLFLYAVMLAMVNCYSLKLATKMMSLLSVAKMFALLFIVIIGVIFILVRSTFPHSFTHPFDVLSGQEPSVPSISLSIYSVMFAYNGW